MDCGPRALLLVCQKLGIEASLPELRQAAGTNKQGTSLEGLAKAAKQVGLQAEGVQMSREALQDLDTVAIGWTDRNHYVAVLRVSGRGDEATATIHDPNQPEEETISLEKLLQRSNGYLLLLHR